MTPYLVRSSVAHLLLGGLFFALAATNGAGKKVFYTIDFLGGVSGPVATGTGAGPTPTSEAKTPAVEKSGKPEALPSLKRWLPKAKAATLKHSEIAVPAKGKNAPEAVEEPALMGTSRNASTSLSTGEAVGAAGLSLTAGSGSAAGTDLTDFPYPYYLQRLRAALWSQWSSRMPGGGRVCLLHFAIARDGSVSELSVRDSSGSRDFDFQAMSAVNAAAPFPPLPDDFRDPELKVNVKFQSLP